MEKLIYKLSSQHIVNSSDVSALKNYINGTYSHLDPQEKSKLLAKSIHHILDIHLKEFDEHWKNKIKKSLIKKTLAKNIHDIYKSDVFNTIASFESIPNKLLDNLVLWVNNNSAEELTKNKINDYILELTSYEMDDSSKNLNDSSIEIDNSNINELPSHVEEDSLSNIKITFIQSSSSYTTFRLMNSLLKLLNRKYVSSLNVLKRYITSAFNNISHSKLIAIMSISFFLIILPFSTTIVNKLNPIISVYSQNSNSTEELNYNKSEVESIDESQYINNHIPEFLQYTQINELKLKSYLASKNSLLSEEPYFTAIISSAKSQNLNPLVLFAIAGHEQGFVPKSHPKSKVIANNPFNVFQSWENYNTDIWDTSQIAARTVSNLLKGRIEEDPFKWINRKYAQDKNWWKGVKSIYFDLEEKTK